MKEWCVYFVRCADRSLYVGITLDVEERVAKHNAGMGAKYTRSHRPVKLVRTETYATETEARKREAEIKSWRKDQKENLLTRSSS